MRENRKLLILVLCTIVFGFAIIIWYFFFTKPAANPSIDSPTNPFGGASTVIPGVEFVNSKTATSSDQSDNERIPASERVLTQIWDKPTAGYAFVTREIILEATTTTATSTNKKTTKLQKKLVEYVLFVDRLTGRIYGYNVEEGVLFQVTDTTVPNVYDAYITYNGTRVFMRYLGDDGETIKTLTATIPTFIAGGEPKSLVAISSLQDNVTSFAVSLSSNSFSYLVPTTGGSAIYTTNEKAKVTVSPSTFREWYLTYGGEIPYMTTKPSAYLPGYTFSLPGQGYVLGDKTGLMTLPNSRGTTVLASMWSSSGLATFIFSKQDKVMQPLSIKTLASKCVWLDIERAVCGVPTAVSKGEQGLPDDWFQGTISFSDDMYMVATGQGGFGSANDISALLFPLSEQTGQPFDITRPQVDTTASSLTFTNKQTGALWLLNLSKVILPE